MNDGNAGPGTGPGTNHGSRRGTIAALVLIVVLVVGGLWLARTLRGVSDIQDCAMAGRSNCAPIGR